jgi:hypothetical protein
MPQLQRPCLCLLDRTGGSFFIFVFFSCPALFLFRGFSSLLKQVCPYYKVVGIYRAKLQTTWWLIEIFGHQRRYSLRLDFFRHGVFEERPE